MTLESPVRASRLVGYFAHTSVAKTGQLTRSNVDGAPPDAAHRARAALELVRLWVILRPRRGTEYGRAAGEIEVVLDMLTHSTREPSSAVTHRVGDGGTVAHQSQERLVGQYTPAPATRARQRGHRRKELVPQRAQFGGAEHSRHDVCVQQRRPGICVGARSTVRFYSRLGTQAVSVGETRLAHPDTHDA